CATEADARFHLPPPDLSAKLFFRHLAQLCSGRYSHQSRPVLQSRQSQYSRRTSTRLADEKRRRSAFARRNFRKSALRRHKNEFGSALAAKSGRPFRSSG